VLRRRHLCATRSSDGIVDTVDEVLYDDGGLVLDGEGLTIRRYYFPWAGAKRIPYQQIRRALVRPMGWLSGRGRGWGTSHPGYWFPLDLHRAAKHAVVVLDLGHRVKPCVTPDDPDRVIQLLSERVPTEPT
jgi:hypothetical protein